MINGEAVDDAMEAIADVVRERLEKGFREIAASSAKSQESFRGEWNERYQRLEKSVMDALAREFPPITPEFNPEFNVGAPDMAPLAKVVGEALERYAKQPSKSIADLTGLEKQFGLMVAEIGNLAGVIDKNNELLLKLLKEMVKKPEPREVTIKHGDKESKITMK